MWTANDWSNIVTISSAALASVLLVLFKSRCSRISLCWGLWSCDRVVPLSKRGDPWRDGAGFRGADGSCDKFGGPVPKHYRYASILDASASREARKLVAAAAMDRVLEELRNDDA